MQLIRQIQFLPADDHENGGRQVPRSKAATGPAEDLAYRVELWTTDHSQVEQVLAMSSGASIGYAAYYAATREYPDRYLTLRHKGRILNRWNGPTH